MKIEWGERDDITASAEELTQLTWHFMCVLLKNVELTAYTCAEKIAEVWSGSSDESDEINDRNN